MGDATSGLEGLGDFLSVHLGLAGRSVDSLMLRRRPTVA